MIHENIVRLAKERKIPLYAIEAACGLQPGAISKWKYVSPITKNLKAVSDYLGVTMDELCADTVDKTEST